jgi:hypothetical protein
MAEVLRCVFKAKAGTNKAVKINDEWFEIRKDSLQQLVASLPKPYPEVEVVWEKEGYKKVLTSIVVAGQPAQVSAPKPAAVVVTGSTTKPEVTNNTEYKVVTQQEKATDWNKKDRQIRRGNALNAAAASLAGTFPLATELETIKETVLVLAQNFYEWLEANADN